MGVHDESARPERSRVRRLILGSAWAGFALVLLTLLGLGALHLPPVRQFALRQMVAWLEARQIGLSASQLDYNLAALSISLEDARLWSTAAPELEPFLTAEAIDVNLRLRSLIGGRYVVDSARVDGIDLHYVVVDDTRSNLPLPPAQAEEVQQEPSTAIDYLVRDTVLTNGRVRYEDRAQGIDAVLQIERLAIDGQLATRRHDVALAAGPGTVVAADRRIGIERIGAALDLGANDVVVEDAQLRAEGSTVSVSGRVSDFSAPVLDLDATAAIDAAAAARAAGGTEPLAGGIAVEAQAEGPLPAVVVTVTAQSDDLAVRALPPATVHLRARYLAEREMVELTAARVDAPYADLDASGRLALNETGTTTVEATIGELDALAISTALDLPYRLGSSLRARVDGSMPGLDYARATGSAVLALNARRDPAPGLVPVDARLRAAAADGRVRLDIERMRALGAAADGAVTVTQGDDLGGAVRVRVADAGDVVAAVEQVLAQERGSLTTVPISGALTLAATLGGTTTAPEMRARLDAPALTVGPLRDLTLTSTAAVTPRTVRLGALRAAWREAQVTASGRVGLSEPREVRLRADATGLEVADLLAVAGVDDVPASGTASASAALAGTVSRPRADVQVEAVDLSAYQERLGALQLEARLDGQVARVTRLTLDKPQASGAGRLELTGEYDLRRGAYAFDVHSTDLRVEQLVLPGGTPVTATLELEGAGRGSVDDPSGTLAFSARALELDARSYGDLTARLAVEDRRARLQAAAPRFNLTVSAEAGTTAPFEGRVELVADRLPLDALPLDDQTPLAGTLSARVVAEGPAQTPADGTVLARLAGLEARWNGQPITLGAPAEIRLADQVVTVEDLSLRALESALQLRGRLPLDAEAAPGTVVLDATLDLASLAAYAPPGTEVSAEGMLTMQGEITGTARAIAPALAIRLRDGLVLAPELDVPVTGLTLEAAVRDGALRVERLAAAWGAATLEASAGAPLGVLGSLPVDLPSRGGVAVDARVAGLDLAALPGAPEGLAGQVAVVVEATAPGADLDALEGQARFDQLELTFRDLTLAQQQPSRIAAANGVARIEQLELDGSVGHVNASGSVGLDGDYPVNLTATGTLDIAAASAMTDAFSAEGPARFEIAATGPAAALSAQGFVELTEARVVVDDPADVAVEHLAARLDLSGERITLTRLDGLVNGGTLSGGGSLTLGTGVIERADMQLTIDELAFSAPLDLRSLSDVGLRLTTEGEDLVVGGTVTIAEAGLTGDVNFDTGILATIGRPRGLDLTAERDPLLERVRLDIAVETETPILVDNNLAKAELTTDVRVLGTPYEFGLAGRMELLEGSSVTLNERRYQVDRGVITFTGQREIAPTFDLALTTEAGRYDVTLGVTGAVGETETVLTSNPSLPEPDIMALLVTGRTLEEMRGAEYDVAREQVLSYLTGRVGSALGRGVEQATGLSEVRIEPNLIANEADPGARLTVAQELASELRLIYSSDLADTSNQFWVAEYDITRRFQTRAVRQADNSYRLEFRHDVRFGGTPEPARVPRMRPRVGDLSVAGADPIGEAQIRDLFGLEPGEEYDFFAARQGVERIEEALRDRGYLQSRVQLERNPSPDATTIDVALRVEAGPLVDLRFEGLTPPEEVRDAIQVRWQRGVFDSQRGGDGRDEIREWLVATRRLDARVEYRVEGTAAGTRRVVFTVHPGPQFEQVTLAFPGAGGVSPDVLRDIVADQELEAALFTDPTVVTELLERYYREEGYLAAEIAEPELEFAGREARVLVPVREGPRFVVSDVVPRGNTVVATPAVRSAIPLRTGDPFLPAVAERSLDLLRQLYWRRGYNEVRLRYALEADRDRGAALVHLEIEEGPRSVVAEIQVEGTERTSEGLVRSELQIDPDGVLDLGELGRSRRSLYATGAYSIVELTREVIAEPADATAAPGNGQDGPTADRQVTVTATVREVQPFQIRYGASFDTERGLGGVFDFTNYNSLGSGRQVGVSTRYDTQLRQARLFLSQPMLQRLPFQTTASAYVRQERNPDTDVSNAFNVDRLGVSLQQERRLANRYVWNYGAVYERTRTFDPRRGAALDQTLNLAPLTTTLLRETRDEILDATRGSFASQALTYAPGWLGSDAAYLKYFGQYFKYFPLEPERRERLTNEILRPRLVYATGVRLGLANGLGGPVPLSERFFAGGSTSLRGFAQNAVGPRDATGIPTGGDATLILNNELRFPLVSLVDGVGFVDIGGVFAEATRWSVRELREVAGVGLRVRTPWFLLRGDYGFTLDRRAGEPRSRFFFSIGQAF